MNFLLHHHLAARDRGSPAAAAGAMLPDLWRMADRRVRARRDVTPEATTDDALAEVLRGIEHHLVADRWFHADAVFREGEQRAVVALREAAVKAPRIGLFAHILWELCLDGALLLRVGLGETIGALREGFTAVADGEVASAGERAAGLHHFDGSARSEDERRLFSARMERLFVEIARGPWIDGYQNGEGIAFRIEGVRARFGLAPLAWEDHLRLAEVASGLLEEAPPVVERILAWEGPSLP